jgi:mono/diheme cytochrome c family protein
MPAKEHHVISIVRTAAVLLLAASVAGPAFAQAPGADVYRAKCGSCHGADGLAATPVGKSLKVLSFKAPEMVKASDARFIAATKNGKGKMPGYAGKLTDAQIKDVISYVRTLQK